MVFASKWIEIDAGHRVPDHKDHTGAPGQCSSPHGHRWQIEITIDAPVAGDGMTVDYGIMKRLLMAKVHDPLDHAMILDGADPLLHLLADHGQEIRPGGFKLYAFPGPPTAENLAIWVSGQVRRDLEAVGAVLAAVAVKETPSSSATWAAR